HELRTPLTSVIGYSEMLLEGLAGELNSDQREYLGTILSKAEQLLQLITGILDVSMLESGSLDLRSDAVVMPDLVESVVATVRPSLRKRQITLERGESDMPRVLGDHQKIREILRNLITNAIKFTPERGHIHVSLAIGPLKPDQFDGDATADRELGFQVIIADSGIGIAQDKQARIFEPFFQVDSSSTRAYGGSGLGLTLAKRYVEALGGHIWVDSSPGRGSSFTVSFPLVVNDLRDYLDRDIPAS
ncbi:MAG: HAMP domain-containing sensor histidine kinase, partial [Myxococcota bacterium]